MLTYMTQSEKKKPLFTNRDTLPHFFYATTPLVHIFFYLCFLTEEVLFPTYPTGQIGSQNTRVPKSR